MILILTGNQGVGKTTFLEELIKILRYKSISVGGILSKGYWKDNERDSFDIVNIKTGQSVLLCDKIYSEDSIKFKDFYFKHRGIHFGEKALDKSNFRSKDIVAIDEIGGFELEDKGWSKKINDLMKTKKLNMIWVVRKCFVELVIKKWNVIKPVIWDVEKQDVNKIAKEIIRINKKLK